MSEKKPTKSEARKSLVLLTRAVLFFIRRFDEEMKKPPGYERGQRIAGLTNSLDIANDSAMHFTLGYSFNKIKKFKEVK